MNFIKEYYEEFSILPTPVKTVIIGLSAFLIIVCLFFGTSNLRANRKIEKLEMKNAELQKDVETAQGRAILATEKAALESEKSANLESQLVPIEKKAINQNEKIKQVSKKTSTLRDNLNRIRRDKPQRTDSSNLERRLENRYRAPNSNR